ncbi:LysR family transcriptional regulator [Paenibacillus sp. GP183]|uniref:LysR family transcriptional regulator n=1 Tax=Paenibacillus sp. GP183 TaxID=1882751 RepID=UPI000895820E|nr:LysR family transcriptional regulator [Paenibacillus sp. GP183]SEB39837.1 DNA-binding transcriptional regulator, LysR family [Paenibacillus sp. GP183]
MDLKQLSYLLEIAKQLNFTKAAESLHLTQPTLSKMVKHLEDELGVILFDRSGKYVKLTDAGMAAIQQIQVINQSVQDLYTSLNDVSNLRTGSIRIGLPPVIGTIFFPSVVAKFQKEYPRIDFHIVEEGAKKVESRILEGKLDLGVVVAPVDNANFEILPYLNEELALILHESHPLAGKPSVALMELSKEPFILFPDGFAVRKHIMQACSKVGFEPRVTYESAHWDLLAEMVAANTGISILPQAISGKINNPSVKTIRLTNPTIPWNLIIIWHKAKYQSYAMREFKRFISMTAIIKS